ncbi:Uncharacterised protein [Pseudomonas aeruginosa]|nr:Uncharacterised protein [Pseudomonas aeruginosa]
MDLGEVDADQLIEQGTDIEVERVRLSRAVATIARMIRMPVAPVMSATT